MNTTHLAENVRRFRQLNNWTQQHCAEAIGIQLRTLQRVESAQGVSAETLAALAAGFNTSVDFLQTDLEALVIELQQEELQKTHNLVSVTPVVASADLNIIDGARASFNDCQIDDDAVQDAFAALRTNLADMIDVWDNGNPVQHREWLYSAFQQVEELNRLGCVVSIGKQKTTYQTGNGTVDFHTLYVVVWPKNDVRTFVAVKKSLDI